MYNCTCLAKVGGSACLLRHQFVRRSLSGSYCILTGCRSAQVKHPTVFLMIKPLVTVRRRTVAVLFGNAVLVFQCYQLIDLFVVLGCDVIGGSRARWGFVPATVRREVCRTIEDLGNCNNFVLIVGTIITV